MKISVAVLFAACLAASGAKASQADSAINFVVSHPTIISAIGAYDGGTAFTSTETVGVFNDVTGNLVGPEVIFGPGKTGTQLGNTFFESVPDFVLAPGDYSMIFSGSSSSQGGNQVSGGNSFENLSTDVNLPGGGRFDSGANSIISLSEGANLTSANSPFDLVDPTVPDGGTTAMLLGASLAGIGWLRRKI
jgi:VPDSG-CTERM motif